MSLIDQINNTNQKMYNSTNSIEDRFNTLIGEKSIIIERAETYARWTLPNILSADTDTPLATEKQHDFQSIGARAVNHLANKLAFTLFAPARPFFKLMADEEYLQELEVAGMPRITVDSVLAKAEKIAMKRFGTWKSRTAAIFALKNIIITGNALLYFPKDGKAQTFNFRDYVVKRDLSGKVIDIITRDRKKVATLPPVIRQFVLNNPNKKRTDEDDANLFTRIVWSSTSNKYLVFQAVDEFPISSVNGRYSEKELPWITLTWNLQRGADYGTGLVEDYAGDFHTISTLTRSLVIGTAISADIKFLVDPAGNTDYKMLNDAETGSYVPGREEDISTLTTDKQKDWQFVLAIIDKYEKRVGQAFLLGSAITRDAERVTAEEIRFQAQELETSLGGQFSRLSEEFQIPMSHILLKDIDFSINGSKIEPVIITGLESLSRNSEVDNLNLFLSDMANLANLPEQVLIRLEYEKLMAMYGNARSIDYEQFVKPEETVKREQETLMQQQLELQKQAGMNSAVNNATEHQLTKE